MATAKKKPSAKSAAKPGIKYAAKNQSYTKAASAKQASTSPQWERGASDWVKESAKLYQLPFNNTQATEAAKTATEGMMSFAQQMFDQSKKNFSSKNFDPAAMFKAAPQMPGFDAKDAQEKFTRFAQESAEQLNKTAGNAQSTLHEAGALFQENSQVLAEVSNLLVTLSKELAAEYISYLNKTFTQNIEIGKQIHNCRTLNDLFDLSSQCMKMNLDSFFSESIRFSEKLFRSGNNIAEPLNECMSSTTDRLNKVLSA